MNVSGWLQNLANFCGHIYRKYHNMELNSILEYITTQLRQHGNALDLILLGELVHKMGGIESLEELSEAQIECQAGGELLRQEVGRSILSHTKCYNAF